MFEHGFTSWIPSFQRSIRMSYSRVSQLFFLHGEAATGKDCNLQLKEKFVLRMLVMFSTNETSDDTVSGDGANDFLYALTLRLGITCLGRCAQGWGWRRKKPRYLPCPFQPPVYSSGCELRALAPNSTCKTVLGNAPTAFEWLVGVTLLFAVFPWCLSELNDQLPSPTFGGEGWGEERKAQERIQVLPDSQWGYVPINPS